MIHFVLCFPLRLLFFRGFDQHSYRFRCRCRFRFRFDRPRAMWIRGLGTFSLFPDPTLVQGRPGLSDIFPLEVSSRSSKIRIIMQFIGDFNAFFKRINTLKKMGITHANAANKWIHIKNYILHNPLLSKIKYLRLLIISTFTGLLQETRKNLNKQSNFMLRVMKRTTNKAQSDKEVIKIRAEISEMESKKNTKHQWNQE